MAKKQTTEDQVVATEPAVYDGVAVGNVKLANGKYRVVSVKFNSETGQAGGTETYSECDDIYEAFYDFKMAASKNGLL